MRVLAVLMLLVWLSGCMGAAPDDEDSDGCDAVCEAAQGTDPADPDTDDDGILDGDEALATEARQVPAPIVIEGELRGIGYQGVLPVSPPVDPVPECTVQQCAEHVVDVPAGDWTVTFTLVGTSGPVTGNDPAGVVSTDYDLYVDGVGESLNAAGSPDEVSARLSAGDYTVRVLGWQDLDGSYTLTVTFA